MFKKIGFWLITIVVLFIVISPLVWIYLTSLKAPDDIFTMELKKLVAFNPTLDNYTRLFSEYPFWKDLGNTALISIVSTLVVMFVALLASYSFARWNTGGGHLLFTTISTRMFPGVVAAIPFFVLFRTLGMIDKHIAVMLLYIYFNTSFATFLLYGYFRDVPAQLEQAAMVDGYSRMEIFRKIVFPLILPGLAVTTVFCLIWSWNEFFYAFLFTRVNAKTATVLISSFWGSIEVQYGPMAAGAAITILPTLVAALGMQRYIIRGLTFGAVKG